jgi:ribosomal protein L37AE/L43A
MTKYQVVVGNLGLVHESDDRQAAEESFKEYVDFSKSDYGRVAGEPVTLFEDGEILKEYCLDYVEFECPQCGETMTSIGDGIFQCVECDYENSKEGILYPKLVEALQSCSELFDNLKIDNIVTTQVANALKLVNTTE